MSPTDKRTVKKNIVLYKMESRKTEDIVYGMFQADFHFFSFYGCPFMDHSFLFVNFQVINNRVFCLEHCIFFFLTSFFHIFVFIQTYSFLLLKVSIYSLFSLYTHSFLFIICFLFIAYSNVRTLSFLFLAYSEVLTLSF